MSSAPTPSIAYRPHVKAGLSPNTIAVESQTKPGTYHLVNTCEHRCSCPAGKHGRLCWHLGVGLAYAAWRQQQRVQATVPAFTRPAGMAALVEAFS